MIKRLTCYPESTGPVPEIFIPKIKFKKMKLTDHPALFYLKWHISGRKEQEKGILTLDLPSETVVP